MPPVAPHVRKFRQPAKKACQNPGLAQNHPRILPWTPEHEFPVKSLLKTLPALLRLRVALPGNLKDPIK
jgi:hypothetical protein